MAENILGTAEHHLELEEAREPGVIHEVRCLLDIRKGCVCSYSLVYVLYLSSYGVGRDIFL